MNDIAHTKDSWWQWLKVRLASWLIMGFARSVTGLRGNWHGCQPDEQQTLYFANHASHGDFVLIWATIPRFLRRKTRPVAGQDYWQASALRRFIGHDVFNALMISRKGETRTDNPVAQMAQTLESGDSLIMFPEGTRNTGEEPLLPLKSGLYHLANRCPQARLVPVWIDNLHRVLPKGRFIPVPLACTVTYGQPIQLLDGESKEDFLARAAAAMLELRPEHNSCPQAHTTKESNHAAV